MSGLTGGSRSPRARTEASVTGYIPFSLSIVVAVAVK
jgi:hypothetical protein